ncbi:glycosyltransferase family 4 protein [Lunatibacter salilacus]|uniref:glycosyltransferase family 4 protein n=1 Tax=Lunatibacter salilacus TaxID=2483804 RepID=UPI00131E2BE8|nr:glycosyltransferase family 4 protein [Lunatibacter salilacus]
MDVKTICLVIPSLQSGGMERVMSELANYFCGKREYEIHLILYGLKREIFYQVPENIHIHIPDFDFDNNKRTWNTIKTLWFLRQKIKAIQPDTVLSFGELWNNFVLLANLGLKNPVFVSDRCQPNKSLGKLHDALRKWLYPKAAGVICQTELARGIYSKMFSHTNLVVIGNPIRSIEKNPLINKENIILSVGRLIKSKHHDELIRIFSKIEAGDWKLIIVGDDALKEKNKEKLASLIQELGLKERVELAGKRLDVEDFYNKAKIFAFTSSSEGFPNVVGEAMSAGLPVVAYDCVAGPSDLIEHQKTGYLIKINEVNSFKDALEKLIKNESLRGTFGYEGKIKIQEFSVTNIAKQFEKIILNAHTSN